jgi:hypothetical protein
MHQKYRVTATVVVQLRRTLVAAAALFGSASQAQVVAPNANPPATAAAATDTPATNTYQGEYYTSDLNEVFRLRHIEGRGQGDVPAFTNIGFTKFVWNNHGLLMLDLGARVTNEAEGGFTGGAHFREIIGNHIVGTGVFYDLQEFSQLSVAFEVFSRNWTFRANGYGIVGDDVEADIDLTTTPGSTFSFAGNNLVGNGLEEDAFYEVAMNGVDFELGRNLWRSTEAFAGGYYLEGDIGGDTVGGKGGVRGFLMPDLAASITVSHDDFFDTNVYGGFTWFFGANGGLSRPAVDRKLTIPVERNEQIAVHHVHQRRPISGTLVLESGDDPIVIVHVDSSAAGPGDGTFEDPFNTMPATQDADIVYVHSGSSFSSSYVMAASQRLLGEGDNNLHLVEIDDLGEIVLPESTLGGHALPRPVFTGITGDAITLADDDNEVSNFRIQNTVGNGIAGDGITDFDINRNIITGTTGDAADPMLLATGRGIFLRNVFSELDEDGELANVGEVEANQVTGSEAANIEIVLGSDFLGEVNDNTATGSATAEGIFIHGPFAYLGEVSGNTAGGNFTDGIGIEVDEFLGEVANNTTNANMHAGLALSFGIFNGEITGNTANSQVIDVGIDLSITGDGRSVFEVSDNTTNNNAAEGILMQFSGTGMSFAQVLDNNLAGNNGGTGREFFAFNEDIAGNEPEVFIELDGNISTNVVVAPMFNYEFDNEDLFSNGEMTVELGLNVGTVEIDEEVEYGDFPL